MKFVLKSGSRQYKARNPYDGDGDDDHDDHDHTDVSAGEGSNIYSSFTCYF
jgi:hypothetical protein